MELEEKYKEIKATKGPIHTNLDKVDKCIFDQVQSNLNEKSNNIEILKGSIESLSLKSKVEKKALSKKLNEVDAENEVLKQKLRESEHVLY